MTYKKVLQSLIEREASKWLEEVLVEQGYKVKFCFGVETESENCKEYDSILWEVKCDVMFEGRPCYDHYIVGGSACDLTGICCSVIWDMEKHRNILWMANEETRKDLGIIAFGKRVA